MQKTSNLPQTLPLHPKCYNCKHASAAFKIAGKTHHQCNHPKHEKDIESGELSPWATLQEWNDTCETHEFRKNCSIPDVPRQRFSFDEREPEMNECISLVWENGSDCECIYTGLDKTILPLPTHWYYVD